MKQLRLLSYLLVAVLCIGFTSCSDDDKEDKKDYSTLIVGNWKLNKAEGFDDNWHETFTGEEYMENFCDGNIVSLVFYNGGTGDIIQKEGGAAPFTWVISEDVIKFSGIKYEDLFDSNFNNIKTLNSSTLVIESSRISSEGEGYIYTFKK